MHLYFLTIAVVSPETPAPTMTVSKTALSSTVVGAAALGAIGEAVAVTKRWRVGRRAIEEDDINLVPTKFAFELPMRAAFPLATVFMLMMRAIRGWVVAQDPCIISSFYPLPMSKLNRSVLSVTVQRYHTQYTRFLNL